MKKLLQLLFTVLGLVTFTQSWASHVMGSDITYRCLGNGKYEVTATVYRDCNGIQLSNSPISIKCSAGTFSASLTEIQVRDVTGIGSNCTTQSRCSGSYAYGIEEHTYQGTIDLSSYNCCEVTLSWEQCCRNGAITTGASGANFYTEAQLNKCINPCNSSPRFTSLPTGLICVGQDFVFNNGASDTVDVGDSLSYSMVEPLSGAGAAIAYSGNYSSQKPIYFLGFPNANIGFPGGFHLDSVTGDLSFRPTKQNEVTVMVIEVKEWRTINGTPTVVGITRRDMQIIVTTCPNNKVPKLAGKSAIACAGSQICVNVTSDDDDQDDTVRLTWNRGIPKANFTNNNGTVKHPGGSVCWTPTDADVSNIPYTFTVTAKDDACPRPGQAVRAFSITVRESPKATRSLTKLICGKVAVDFTPAKNNYPGFSYNWSVKDSTNANVFYSTKKQDTLRLQPGTNRVFLTLSTSTPCVNAFVDTIVVDPFVQVKLPKDTFLCDGNPMTLVSTTKNGKPAYHYKWNTNDTTTQITVNSKTDTAFYITVKDGEGCDNSDTIKIKWKPLPKVNKTPDARICWDSYQTFDAGDDSLPKLRFLWSTGDTSRYITRSDSNRYTVKVIDTIGCYNYDTINLFVNTVPIDGGPDQYICDKDTAHFTASGADSYQWFVAPNLSVPAATTSQYSLPIAADKLLYVKGTRTNAGLTCYNTDSVNVFMNALPEIKFGPISPRCLNSNPFMLTTEALAWPTLTSGTWSGITSPSSVSADYFYPDVAGAGTHKVRYNLTDGNGCKNSATIDIIVNPLPVTVAKDGSYCGYDGLINLINHISPQSQSVQGLKSWKSIDPGASGAVTQQGFNYFFNTTQVSQEQTYALELKIIQTGTNCENRDTAMITVRKVPAVDVSNTYSLCQNNPTADLNLASIANPTPAGGTWTQKTGGKGLENQHFFNPTLADSNNSKNWVYYTYDIPGNNCPVTDSIAVTVKPRPAITIVAPGSHCIDEGTISLASSGQPLGGTWSGDGGITAGGSFDTKAAGQGTYNLKYDYTGANGCKWQEPTTITVMPAPTLTVDLPKSLCVGEIFNLKAQYTVAKGVQWLPAGDGTFGSPSADNTTYQPGTQDNADEKFTFKVRTTGTLVCPEVEKQYTVGIYPKPSAVILASPDKGCEPLPVTFTAITDQPGGAKYEWEFGDGQGTGSKAKEKYEYKKFGVYSVTLKVTNGTTECWNQATPVTITVYPTPNADFKMSREITTVAATDIAFTDLTTIGGSGKIKSYTWEFGDAKNSTSNTKNPLFVYPTDTGKYIIRLEVVSEDNCRSEHIDTLQINPDITVFIPNAFTPNLYGPARNNRFYVTAEGFLTFEVFIFNRWGEKVYYSTDINQGWDGMFKGEFAQQDVYTYVVNVTSFSGKPYSFYGTVTLLR